MTQSSRSDHGFYGQGQLWVFYLLVAIVGLAGTALWVLARPTTLSCYDEAVETCTGAKGATWESVGLCIKDEQAVCLEARTR